MKIKLFVKHRNRGTHATALFETSASQCLIGRRNSDLLLTDVSCSRQHALIYLDPDGKLRMKDLESTNGTFISGRNIDDCELNIGDEVRIGDVLIVVVDFHVGSRTVREGTDTRVRDESRGQGREPGLVASLGVEKAEETAVKRKAS